MSDNHHNGRHSPEAKHQSFQLDTVAVHLALLRNGKIIAFTGDDHDIGNWNIGKSSLWDPANPNIKENPTLGRNLFCSGHCFLPDGRLLVAGGQSTVSPPYTNGILSFFGILQLFTKGADHDIHIFDPQTQTWDFPCSMPTARWYPTCVTLPDGKALIVSGVTSQAHHFLFKNGFINQTYEIFDGNTNSLSIPKPFFKNVKPYPFLFVLPGGTLFVHSEYITRLLKLSNFESYPEKFETIHKGTRTYPGMGCCTLLPIKQDASEFKILIAGGSRVNSPNNRTDTTDSAEIFTFRPADLSSSSWNPVSPMNRKRILSDSVLLPDGTILVTNGAAFGTSDDNSDSVKEIELYDPEKDSWSIIDTLDRDRLYHSSALLLTDGTVIAAGSTGHKWSTNPEHYEKEIEILIPPYLKDSPQRPNITDCPSDIHYDREFEITTNTSDVSKIVIIRNSSTTHNNNMDQRYVLLTILEQVRDIIKISGPKDGTYAPPGYYMLFILDKKSIPSIAKVVRIS